MALIPREYQGRIHGHIVQNADTQIPTVTKGNSGTAGKIRTTQVIVAKLGA